MTRTRSGRTFQFARSGSITVVPQLCARRSRVTQCWDPTPQTLPPPPSGNDPDPSKPDSPPPRNSPERDPTLPHPDLVQAIERLTESNKGSVKIKEPDVFDGSDSRKLHPFLVQIQLQFNNRPKVFETHATKINYALSYLHGTALDYFKPALLDKIPPPYMFVYDDFREELEQNFGPHDPVGDAEASIENLRMKDNQRITKYVVEFNRLSTWTEWGEAALWRQFYKGLPARIKDEICRIGKPDTLLSLQKLAQTIDAHYWECRSESAHENPAEPKKSDSGKNIQNSGNQNKGKQPDCCSNNSDNCNKSTSSSSAPKKGPDLTGKLSKDGKLTPEECARWMANNLCLFCGGPGHTAKECPCPTSSASQSKSRSARVEKTSEAKSESTSDSKKE